MRGLMAGIVGFGGIVLWLGGVGIYLFTLYLAYLTSFPSLLLTMFFPVLSQIYWIWMIWHLTGVFFHLLTILCLGWIALAAILGALSVAIAD
jgi:hypothetical protein